MPAILRDQVWQFVGAFFGLVAIIVSIALYRTQRRRKALSYELIALTPLLSVEDEVKGKVQILFDGNPVQDIHLVVLKLINSGNVPIVSTDYERPVSLTFGENPQILSAEVSETNPDNLGASVDIEATRVMLEPILLNGGDSITLKLLVSKLSEISVDGRIVGVKQIRKFVPRQFKLFVVTLGGGGILSGFIGLLMGFILYSVSQRTSYSYPIVRFLDLGAIIVLGIISLSAMLLLVLTRIEVTLPFRPRKGL